MAYDPPQVGGGPPAIAFFHVVNDLHRPRQRDQMSTGRPLNAFGVTCVRIVHNKAQHVSHDRFVLFLDRCTSRRVI